MAQWSMVSNFDRLIKTGSGFDPGWSKKMEKFPFLQFHDVHQLDHMDCEFFPGLFLVFHLMVEEKNLCNAAS